MLGYANIYGDVAGATHTPVSSAFAVFPGSSVWTGVSNSNYYIKTRQNDTTSLGFTVGYLGKGTWKASWNAGFTGDVGSQTYHIALFKNGTKIDNTSMERKLGTAGDIGSAGNSGIVALQNNDAVDLYVQVPTTATQITLTHLSIVMEMLSTSTVLG